MKTFIFTTICCLFFSLCIIGQTETSQADKSAGIEEIYLAKDDGKGEIGDVVTSFVTTDIPIYCVVQLDSMSAVTVKMNLVAVKVKGVKPESKVITTSYKTNGKQSRVNFTGKPEGNWVAGSYRIDIFLDDKPAGNQVFEIQESANSNKKSQTQTTEKKDSPTQTTGKVKSTPQKPISKSKNAKLIRKN